MKKRIRMRKLGILDLRERVCGQRLGLKPLDVCSALQRARRARIPPIAQDVAAAVVFRGQILPILESLEND